ncbi:MAG: alpha/beta fold hydrolase [bacterium]
MKRLLLAAVALLVVAAGLLYFAFPRALYGLSIRLERKTAGLSAKTLQVGAYTIAYTEGGRGEDMLLVHGFGANKDNWNRIARYLTPRFRVIALDLPGFGESSRVQADSYSIRDQVGRLDLIAAALGLESFHLAGNSMGGAIAGRYAAEFPQKVKTLALLNAGGLKTCPNPSELSREIAAGRNRLLTTTAEDFDGFLEFVFVDPPWIPGPVKAHLSRQSIEDQPFREKVFREIQDEGSSLEPVLAEIQAKTLILWGDRDRLIDVSCTQVLEKGLARAQTVILENCGHAPMIERPQETAQRYLEFLEGASNL